jgi:hypothetical protein
MLPEPTKAGENDEEDHHHNEVDLTDFLVCFPSFQYRKRLWQHGIYTEG